MRRARPAATVMALTLTCLSWLLLISPAAGAATVNALNSPEPTRPVALASTGLDITTPVIIGLATLVVGIGLVCWAFLRRGSAGHPHR